jgi:hypothetical protein
LYPRKQILQKGLVQIGRDGPVVSEGPHFVNQQRCECCQRLVDSSQMKPLVIGEVTLHPCSYHCEIYLKTDRVWLT